MSSHGKRINAYNSTDIYISNALRHACVGQIQIQSARCLINLISYIEFSWFHFNLYISLHIIIIHLKRTSVLVFLWWSWKIACIIEYIYIIFKYYWLFTGHCAFCYHYSLLTGKLPLALNLSRTQTHTWFTALMLRLIYHSGCIPLLFCTVLLWKFEPSICTNIVYFES